MPTTIIRATSGSLTNFTRISDNGNWMKVVNSIPVPLVNGANDLIQADIPIGEDWVVEMGGTIFPQSGASINNLTELHAALSDTGSLMGPPDGSPRAVHVDFKNGQAAIWGTAFAIWEAGFAARTVHGIMNMTFSSPPQMTATSWINAFRLT